jgi:hypothetical protein
MDHCSHIQATAVSKRSLQRIVLLFTKIGLRQGRGGRAQSVGKVVKEKHGSREREEAVEWDE